MPARARSPPWSSARSARRCVSFAPGAERVGPRSVPVRRSGRRSCSAQRRRVHAIAQSIAALAGAGVDRGSGLRTLEHLP
jgi:hypothetical protein